jgi:hypothetical protein
MKSEVRAKRGACGVLSVVLLALGIVPVAAQRPGELPKRASILDIQIGTAASAIPDEFINYACGTNGGPPSIPLANFAQFNKCKPDVNGLREVYFEYDDELEYRALALDLKNEIRLYNGTTLYEYPIVASLLFDETGRVRGTRMVTDPRQHGQRRRGEFWTLANFLRQRYGEEDWKCTDLPPEEGEHPVGSEFIKNHCEKTADGLRMILEQRYLQKEGQAFVDPHTGKAERDAYDSVTRCEIYDAELPVKTGSN